MSEVEEPQSSEPRPALSVIVPARDAAEYLDEQLDALLAQDGGVAYEVIVVDNGSTDATAEIVQRRAELDPRVRLEHAAVQRGANYTRTCGVLAARAERLAFCDADDIVGERWVAAMASALDDAECATGPIDVDRLNPEWLVATRGRYAPDEPRRVGGAVTVVTSGNMALRRAAWERAGRFANDLDTVAEDVEFSLRLWKQGATVAFAPDAVVYYRYRADARALFRQGRAYGRSRPWFYELLRKEGLETPSRFSGWKSWLLVVAWLRGITSATGRARWCWVAGNRLGQLEGCIRWRALWL